MQHIVKNLWTIWAPLMTSRQYLLALGGTLVGTSLLLVSPMQGTLFSAFLAVILWAGYRLVSLHSTYASVLPLLKRTDQTDVPVLLHQVWGEQLHLDQHKISRARQVGLQFQMKFFSEEMGQGLVRFQQHVKTLTTFVAAVLFLYVAIGATIGILAVGLLILQTGSVVGEPLLLVNHILVLAVLVGGIGGAGVGIRQLLADERFSRKDERKNCRNEKLRLLVAPPTHHLSRPIIMGAFLPQKTRRVLVNAVLFLTHIAASVLVAMLDHTILRGSLTLLLVAGGWWRDTGKTREEGQKPASEHEQPYMTREQFQQSLEILKKAAEERRKATEEKKAQKRE